MRVHTQMGSGFQEVVYQRCLSIEFDEVKLFYEREMEMPLYYREHSVGTRRVDFLVEEFIMVEIKAVSKLEDLHLAQAINYLEAYELEIGLLINFGSKSLEFRRTIYSKMSKESAKSIKSV
jgi:GxxExxY protein